MAPSGFPGLGLFILFFFFFAFSPTVQAQMPVSTSLPPVSQEPPSSPTNPPDTPPTPFTTTEVYTPFALCATGGGDWYIDPPTATRLADLFCDEVHKPGNLPAQGKEFDLNEYPTDLIALTANDTTTTDHNNTILAGAADTLKRADKEDLSMDVATIAPNYTLTELSGIIMALRLFRWKDTVLDDVTYASGTQAQCDQDAQQDQCRAGLRRVIDKCQWNSHYFGGVNFWMTGCGMYGVQVANCSGNWLDPNCDLWHRKWPDVGSGPDQSLLTTLATSFTASTARA
ncbi:hypothetical protein AYO20_11255 [Fonsecaea nubica]|uniref:Uncharacterized protein n=1 Tax=Fonsecaea nubica TaxID=856822 RepID=A0A178BZZ1_9EURO|nr:hypothetical protein AYO20_11255 [Fonsecaea nubica]OAL22061.1 hypothetical protein AYO20_11255 [Fonsecaea nubica]